MVVSLLSGFALGLSLILAIGAQNAFVLRQGLRGEHVGAVVLICGISETILVTAGVLGLGALTTAAPWIVPAMRYGGAAFLIVYGARAALSAWRGGASLEANGESVSLRQAILLCLGVTWLNPHAMLDTVVVLGSVSTQAAVPLAFGAGAIAAAWLFFTCLGYGARLLRPIFARPVSWRILDGLIAVFMWGIGLGLILG